MTVEQFFELFLEELKTRDKLREYYKFHDDPNKLAFRKAYFCQRLQYVLDQVQAAAHALTLSPSPSHALSIWDCGCGYATTQIFLALNGIPSRGTTLEFYFNEIPSRLEFWSKYGDMSLVKASYEDVFSTQINENSEDLIIVQDTLHHLEPLQNSLAIFHKTLRPGGKLIAIEENGNNLIQRIKLYKQRGNNRIIDYYDEGLGRTVTMGNENIRPYPVWRSEFIKAGFEMEEDKLSYVRLFPPNVFQRKQPDNVVRREQELWQRYGLLREYFFFGVNFVARKSV
ncbi:MAG: class I SAM-dependent methyltransferase [Saprospiraceae bacterium]|nr:class I SAM-dependent methyltransferase [Saprospiraceae bacterium]MCF8248899.1 class I SAM-dependent methyltransferase [Saprospiraceae bacterium]MCF8279624.1 class I SAM-dependent methyltransferase [Bacteroidales bacterium]MCF8310184.1 class I SAM-dependent methyltransferase [Saprospiraceae bacterium]MCF8439084.1 class I SAM-dependent methyltransferase [Saprospiraceae bacterium]